MFKMLRLQRSTPIRDENKHACELLYHYMLPRKNVKVMFVEPLLYVLAMIVKENVKNIKIFKPVRHFQLDIFIARYVVKVPFII